MANYEILGGNDVNISLNGTEKDGITYLEVNWHSEEKRVPEKFGIQFLFPSVDCYSVFSPSMREGRSLERNYFNRETDSRLASWMPLRQLVSLSGKNRICIALSDANIPTRITSGVREKDAEIVVSVYFFTELTNPITDYKATIRIDKRDIPYYDSVYEATSWWEESCGYTPAYVPDAARMPMNSLWYSYHQDLRLDSIIRECKLTKAMGMDTVIVDDGWQTEDSGGGYAYCGDWEPAPKKIGDMAKLIERIHETGMKVMLWYSVPYIGIYAKNWEQFKDMILDGTGNEKNYFSLDPRYPQVREFLVKKYCDAVRQWKLDGLKLDFIDRFKLFGKSLEEDPRRDTESLEDAIDILMNTVREKLCEINPEILIEFRQTYVGPAIRKYGNMLRVTDCPNDSIKNRADVINLRLTSGKTAVHSDMLMWHLNDPVENAALQFVSSIYSVPQISMLIEELPVDHVKMLTYYLKFWREWRDVLIDGKLTAQNPEIYYTVAVSTLGNKSVITPYCDTVVQIKTDIAVVLNATGTDCVRILGAKNKKYRVVNCLGECVSSGKITENYEKISVPLSGQVFID